jgi:hypothetical protein
MLLAAPFVKPKFAGVSAARLKLAPHCFEVIDVEGNRPGLAWLVVWLSETGGTKARSAMLAYA